MFKKIRIPGALLAFFSVSLASGTTVYVRSGVNNVGGFLTQETAKRSGILGGTVENNAADTNLNITNLSSINSKWLDSAAAGTVDTTGTGNNGAAKWVSYASGSSPTTAGRTAANTYPTASASTSIRNDQSVLFKHTFTIGGTDTLQGSLRILADDTASVWFGAGSSPASLTRIFERTTFGTAGTNFTTCSSKAVGCVAEKIGLASLGNALAPGTYTLMVQVFQINGTSFGTSYEMAFAQVPEPALFSVLAIGLAGLYLRSRIKRS